MSAAMIFATDTHPWLWLMARRSSRSAGFWATTLKYTHLADAAVHEAVEALVPILGGED